MDVDVNLSDIVIPKLGNFIRTKRERNWFRGI